MDAARRDRLQRLQEELLALKASYPDLKLKKTPPTVPGAPFPITVSVTINAPPEASYIDVEYIQLKATIVPSISSIDSNTQHEAPVSGSETFSTALEIEDNSLPSALKHAILSELTTIQNTPSINDNSLCHLGPVLSTIQKEYARLICLVPECLERYQSVDAAGGTVRRVAILREDVHVTMDTSVQLPSPKALRSPKAASMVPATASTTTTKSVSSPNLALPRALQSELEALKKRYSIQMIENIDDSASMLENLHLEQPLKTRASLQSTPPPPSPLIFNIAITPTDPEWKPSGSVLHLTCYISNPLEYPAAGSFGVALKKKPKHEGLEGLSSSPVPSPSPCSNLTCQENAVFDRLLEMEAAGVAGRPGALRAVLRQLENRAGELVCHAVDMAVEIERRRAAAAAAETAAATTATKREGKEATEKHDTSSDSEYSSNSEDWDGDSDEYHSDSSVEEKDEDEEESQDQPLLSKTQESKSQREGVLLHNSLHLVLSGLQLVDIDTLDILKLTLQLACQRCHATCEAVFAQLGGESDTNRKHLSWTGECATCHAHLEATLAPRIVHDGSNILAVLRPEKCVPRDVLPSMVAAQCSSCSNMAAFRSVQIGQWNERNCGHCHRRMAFLAPAVEFSPVRQSGRDGGGDGRRGAGDAATGVLNSSGKSDRDIIITPGQPLPDYGTCRHYRHSRRWLRFPCCGRRFPCDLCHEEATDGHEMKWAGRMVCGYCSVEQPLGQQCTTCGKTVATSATRPSGRRTAFWEGGEGQRDKNRLSKRDPHKFRGSKHKTQSRKDQRVGQKGKEKTERAAAAKSST